MLKRRAKKFGQGPPPLFGQWPKENIFLQEVLKQPFFLDTFPNSEDVNLFLSTNMSEKLWLLLLWGHERWGRVHWYDSGLWGLSAGGSPQADLGWLQSKKNIQTHWSDSDDLSWSNKLSAYLEQVIAQRNMMNNFWEMRLSPDINIVEPCWQIQVER